MRVGTVFKLDKDRNNPMGYKSYNFVKIWRIDKTLQTVDWFLKPLFSPGNLKLYLHRLPPTCSKKQEYGDGH